MTTACSSEREYGRQTEEGGGDALASSSSTHWWRSKQPSAVREHRLCRAQRVQVGAVPNRATRPFAIQRSGMSHVPDDRVGHIEAGP
jgi:hypothetical protein